MTMRCEKKYHRRRPPPHRGVGKAWRLVIDVEQVNEGLKVWTLYDIHIKMEGELRDYNTKKDEQNRLRGVNKLKHPYIYRLDSRNFLNFKWFKIAS